MLSISTCSHLHRTTAAFDVNIAFLAKLARAKVSNLSFRLMDGVALCCAGGDASGSAGELGAHFRPNLPPIRHHSLLGTIALVA